ncbi:wax ester synthase/diacylglycerol acyltransferase 4-like isoform X2 [Diospyros lotus]|uniref:wax ester synthase/diacylglycerol acyltransferase 4-like isoform X2 n=1 Tax=Diospyros lotus TaxID=55363 RepID=UPI00224F1B8C|nr:wax ester synthase/diacylglycerol acyltransferase 4-like isoform X2 [Diospyros lotus]
MNKQEEEGAAAAAAEEEEEEVEPVSPTGQYFNSSALSIAVLGVLESQVPIDDSQTMALLKDLFLPINPRFSSIMVRGKNGEKQWKRVEVNLRDHIKVPTFPPGMSSGFYDDHFSDYMTKIAMEQLPQSRPLWEIHIIKYPTSTAAGQVIFKLHHAMGDGFSMMGALLSCLQRADDPSLPLTFPALKMGLDSDGGAAGMFRRVPRVLSGLLNTVFDFGWSLLKSSYVDDDRTPIRSSADGVEFRPIRISTVTFSLDQIKQIKSNLKVTVNDVIAGIIFLATRLYMQEAGPEFSKANSTALVLLNTRNIAGYKSLAEMISPNHDTKWGNQFGFLHVAVPELTKSESSDPISFVSRAQKIIRRKRDSGAVFLTGKLLDTLRRYMGPEAVAQHIHNTLKNSSMTISNMIGPVEQLALSNHPCAGIYFMVVGVPQSLTITMVSYMGNLRVAVGTEKGYVDSQKFQSSIQKAFEMMFKAAVKSANP